MGAELGGQEEVVASVEQEQVDVSEEHEQVQMSDQSS